MFVENERGSSMQLGRTDAQVTGPSPGVILATTNRFQCCQKKASKSSTNTKSDVTAYKNIAPRCGTYASREGINVKLLSAHLSFCSGPLRDELLMEENVLICCVCHCTGRK